MVRRLWMVTVCVLLLTAAVVAGEIAPSVESWLRKAGADQEIAVWVFFNDKGVQAQDAVQAMIRETAQTYDPRAVERRLRARPAQPFGYEDLRLYRPYVKALEAEGVRFRSFSRWLNAVSVSAKPQQVEDLAQQSFVKSIKRVSGRKGGPRPQTEPVSGPYTPMGIYGDSYRQLAQIQVPDLHAEGYTGEGVVVAILDTGFWLEHECLLGVNVIAEHDFINDDDETANEPGDPVYQHYHGTMCLSLLAGNRPGILMGAAYDAEYILAKTEHLTMEDPIEEDWWIEAAEWADSLGAQIISSSLCYSDWYTYEDMDGETAPITIAADQAAVDGIVVVNAAGNAGASPWRYIMAPADGDSVIAVGSVDSTGVRSAFSSQGPTYDGRVKPTIMAMGQDNFIADPDSAGAYRRGAGTSFACPLVAGAAALMLQKNPGWASREVLEAITATGTRSSAPDTLYGYGILQAWAASNHEPLSGLALGGVDPVRVMAYPNPCKEDLNIRLAGSQQAVLICIYDVQGRVLGRVRVGPTQAAALDLRQLRPHAAAGVLFIEAAGAPAAKVVLLK